MGELYHFYRIHKTNELYHHGILGQKWGVRRYQNEDGSYTAEGRQHYGINVTPMKSTLNPFKAVKQIRQRQKEVYNNIDKIQKVNSYMIENNNGRVIDTKYSDIRKAYDHVEKSSISEKARSQGFVKDKYGFLSKKVNGIECYCNEDGDIDTINFITKDKNYFKNSSIEKAMKKEVNDIVSSSKGSKPKSYPKLQSVYAAGGTAEATYWYDDNDELFGHDITVEFDPKTKKVHSTSMNG